jgi:hypothetical protein
MTLDECEASMQNKEGVHSVLCLYQISLVSAGRVLIMTPNDVISGAGRPEIDSFTVL